MGQLLLDWNSETRAGLAFLTGKGEEEQPAPSSSMQQLRVIPAAIPVCRRVRDTGRVGLAMRALTRDVSRGVVGQSGTGVTVTARATTKTRIQEHSGCDRTAHESSSESQAAAAALCYSYFPASNWLPN
jgi:hypothetical protein